MTLTHRFLSLSILGVMALITAPLAGAEGFGQDLSDEQRQEIRASLEACREDNSDQEDRKACRELETRGEKKACFDAVRDNLDTE